MFVNTCIRPLAICCALSCTPILHRIQLMPTLLLKLLSQPLLVLFMQPCTTLWDCHLAQSSLPGTCYLVFLVSLISYNFVTSTNKRSLVITFVARTIVVATSIILSVTTFLNYSRWISATQNLDSRPTDCIALNKYMRTVALTICRGQGAIDRVNIRRLRPAYTR